MGLIFLVDKNEGVLETLEANFYHFDYGFVCDDDPVQATLKRGLSLSSWGDSCGRSGTPW